MLEGRIEVMDNSFRIRIKKGDFEIEVQGDKKWVEEKLKELMKIEITSPSSLSVLPSPIPSGLPDSIVEFLKLKGNPNTHTEITMIFSYWLTKKEKTKIFNFLDIERCYEEALISKPANITDVMNANQRKGYLRASPEKKDGKKAWIMTLTGERYVEQMKP